MANAEIKESIERVVCEWGYLLTLGLVKGESFGEMDGAVEALDAEMTQLAGEERLEEKVELFDRLDSRRGSHFYPWLAGQCISDPDQLEHTSVAELLVGYDEYCNRGKNRDLEKALASRVERPHARRKNRKAARADTAARKRPADILAMNKNKTESPRREMRFRIWDEESNSLKGAGAEDYNEIFFCHADKGIYTLNTKSRVIQLATGVLDRDGREIFEGDIVEWATALFGDTIRETVEFKNGSFGIGLWSMGIARKVNLKIVGNICEEPAQT
jgi:hypothetical protein